MSDGMYSSGAAVDGVAPQSVEGDHLDLLIGSPMRIERKRFKELSVAYGIPASIRNRLDFVDIYWPNAPAGAVAFDSFPSRDDNILLPGGLRRGEFFHSQAVRRRAILARLNIAFLFRHDGDPALTAAHVGAAYRFVVEHSGDPDTEAAAGPLERTTYEESMTRNMGVAFDPTTGVGVRVKET